MNGSEDKGITYSVIDPDYRIDKSKPCKLGLGDIDSCGERKRRINVSVLWSWPIW